MIGARWGATDAEVAAPQPCDVLAGEGATRADRAISIAAPVGVVYRWLCQLRTAPYSYDLLDNFGRRSPRTLTPGLERLAPGQRVMTLFTLTSFVPDEHLTISSGRHTVVTYAVRPERTEARLAVRVAFALPRCVTRPLLLGDLVMMRKQLLTLKALAERDARSFARREV
ncbi:MAG TPA: hypothetical protein VFF79_01615 [Conexibacter sp.]|jgi:hypothetical protein|nr:hypothetical protein [Conexibacter sp.]